MCVERGITRGGWGGPRRGQRQGTGAQIGGVPALVERVDDILSLLRLSSDALVSGARESHHVHDLDAPSGTLQDLSDSVCVALARFIEVGPDHHIAVSQDAPVS